MFSRCLRRNTLLSPVSKEKVKGCVPLFVYETQEHFYECRGCGRLYWAATHKEHILKELSDMVEDIEGTE